MVASATAVLCALPAVIAALPVPQSPVSAVALRDRVLASGSVPYQGYADTTVNLGLPDLPAIENVSDLLDGNTSQYVWYRSPGSWRADDVTGTGESDTYQQGQVTWLWDYGHSLLTRVAGTQPVRLPRAADLLPPALARRLLGMAAPTDHISRLPSRRVAGVAAAGLRVTPADPGTTIGTIDIWADPRTGLPVQVQITGRGAAQPVLTTTFQQLAERAPPLSVVTPHPAPGVTITTARLPNVDAVLNGDGDGDGDHTPFPAQLGGSTLVPVPGGPTGVAVYGSGFARFVLLPLPRTVGGTALNSAIGAGAELLTITGQTGALIRTPLVNVLLLKPSFRRATFLFAGAVSPAALENAAASMVTSLQRLAAQFRNRNRNRTTR